MPQGNRGNGCEYLENTGIHPLKGIGLQGIRRQQPQQGILTVKAASEAGVYRQFASRIICQQAVVGVGTRVICRETYRFA